MIEKTQEKKEAVRLRKMGKTYSEIMNTVPVAKSTLALWFKELNLSQPQKQKLTQKKRNAQKRGGEARRVMRIRETREIKARAKKEVGKLSHRELWLIGTALYWAEGTKEKRDSRQSVLAEFSNSDPKMIKLYIRWLIDIVGVNPNQVYCYLYIRKSAEGHLSSIRKKWIGVTGLPKKQFTGVYYKKHTIKTNRKNIGDNYFGTLRVWVSKSTDLNRKISGWYDGIAEGI